MASPANTSSTRRAAIISQSGEWVCWMAHIVNFYARISITPMLDAAQRYCALQHILGSG